MFRIPWFKRYRPAAVEQHAAAFCKVAASHRELLEGDPGDPPTLGRWGTTQRRGG